MNQLNPSLELLRRLHTAKDDLDRHGKALLSKFFGFLKSPPAHSIGGTRHLRLRCHRDLRGHIRRISWAQRIRTTKRFGGRTQFLTRYLRGPFRREWIYRIQKDWGHREFYIRVNKNREAYNSLYSATVRALRGLRLSLSKRWQHEVTAEDHAMASELVSHLRYLDRPDMAAVMGGFALQRELLCGEEQMGIIIEDFRRDLRDTNAVAFEPATRLNPNGTIRVYWGFPEYCQTKDGSKLFTRHIPGHPTDRWMRTIRIPEETRRRVSSYIKRLLPLQRTYRDNVDLLGKWRKVVNELVVRVSKFAVPGTASGFHTRSYGTADGF